MRHPDRKITDIAVIHSIIRQSLVMRLALSVQDQPYLIPVCFGFDAEHLYFHTGKSGRKVDFLLANPRLCFEFEGTVRILPHPDRPCKWGMAYETVIGTGIARELLGHEDKASGLDRIMNQYAGENAWNYDAQAIAVTRVWRIDIEELHGRRSKHGFPS